MDPKTLPPPDRSADGIGEVDVATHKVKRVIQAGNDPEQLDISADGQRLYVANEDAAQVSVVDVPSGNVIATVKMGDEPEGVTIRPDGKVVYVTSEDEGAVYAIDTATNKVLKKVPVGHRPRSIGFLPDGSRAFVSLENDGAIAMIDSKAHKFLHLIQLEGKGATPKARPIGNCRAPRRLDGVRHRRLVRSPVPGRSFEEVVVHVNRSRSAAVGRRLAPGRDDDRDGKRTVERRVVHRSRDQGREEGQRWKSPLGHCRRRSLTLG